MAGIAFSNSMVGLVHSLGHAVGATAGVHHGTCMGIFLPVVLRYNLDARLMNGEISEDLYNKLHAKWEARLEELE